MPRIDEACVDGGIGLVRGHNGGRLIPRAAGEPRVLDDGFLMLLRLEPGGLWKISHLIWHRQSPLEPVADVDLGIEPTTMSLSALVPMASVKSVPRSIAFYKKLGFVEGNSHTMQGASEPNWAWLRSGGAQLMLARADDPVDPDKQAVLFYVYCDDVNGLRRTLLEAGVEAGPVKHPFYAPRGEFRVVDPDGYVLMVTHT